MGNESSRAIEDGPRGGGDDGAFDNVILPPMVMVIDHIMWRHEDVSGHSSSSTVQCSATVDGIAVGRPMSFPLPPMSIGGPLRIMPQHPGSTLSLHFSNDAGAAIDLKIPLSKLIRYGAPLCTTLWLGLPLDGTTIRDYDFGQALARGNNADIPKVVVTIFRPSKNQDLSRGDAADPQPDVHGALNEDQDNTCTGPVKRGPTAVAQIKGLIRSLRLMSHTTYALQQELFNAAGKADHGALAKQLQESMQLLKLGAPQSANANHRDPIASAAVTAEFLQLQDMLDESRRENTRLQVEKAEIQERARLQEEHWRQQLESGGAEAQALRNVEALRNQELDRMSEELGSFRHLRDAQEQSQSALADVHSQLEELETLRSQVQTQRGQQLYLQRELTLASEELQSLRALEGQRKSLSQDHAQGQDDLVRTQIALAGAQKDLEQAREELKIVPTIEKQVQYLEAELAIARQKIESLSTEQKRAEEELFRATATSTSLSIEKDSTTRLLEDQLSRAKAELEALRLRDQERPERETENARMRVEVETLRLEKQQWREDLESECHRWNGELEALRLANERQVHLQDELAAKSVELEVMRKTGEIQDAVIKKTGEIEEKAQIEDGVLQETLEKLRAAAPQRLKDLREECAALRTKEKERVALKEELHLLRAENRRHLDEVKDAREAEQKIESRLHITMEELERKKSELLNMRAEREVLRTGDVLRQELVDENLTMREELDKLKKKDLTSRKDLQDQLARASEELNALREDRGGRSQEEVQKARGDLEAWTRQKNEGSGVVTV